MKITVELPDELARRVRAAAALRGLELKDLVEMGLRLVLESAAEHRSGSARPTLQYLVMGVRGVVRSGFADLASSPARLKGFGVAPRRRR
jgi:hypothetical protein